MPVITVSTNQCSKPTGWLGWLVLRRMNKSHSALTDWGLQHVSIESHYTILDVGCGGGRTISKLAARAAQGKVFGVDYSEASVAASRKLNASAVDRGRVEVRLGSVSQLPFAENLFDLVTAVETHFWWPDLPGDMREVFRVTKPGGAFLLIAEVYKGADSPVARLTEKYAPQTGIKLLTIDEHRQLCAHAGYAEVQVVVERAKSWLCAIGKKPLAQR